MKIARDVLERFTALPSDNRELRLLLDDVGLEVKRIDDTSGPLVFTLELLANRGDHHCYEGVAREITGRTGLPLESVETTPLEIDPAGWPLECRTDKLLLYTASLLIRPGEAGSLDADTLRTLEAAGIHSLTAPVDATNLANLEIGQPTHVFDADKVDGAIVIRESVAGEKAWPLFTEGHIDLPEGTLVIADQSKILAIAGVIGCEDSKATAESRRILLESAAFDPVAVRKASRALEIHTDSSARFERGSDPARVLVGAGRVVHLLEQVGWERDGGTSIVGDWDDPARTVRLDCQAANHFLDRELLPEEIADILDRYGFSCAIDGDWLTVQVPTWRIWDVNHPADLYEELAKSIGYNTIPASIPPIGMGSLPTDAQKRRHRIEEVLLGAGLFECFVDGFYGQETRDLLGIDEEHPLWDHVCTANAVERSYGLLKNNCLAQAVQAVAYNLAQKTNDIALFEWTRVFRPITLEATRHRAPCTEHDLLWGVVNGANTTWAGSRPLDVWFLKGLVHEIGVELGLELTVVALDVRRPVASLLHPGRSASIVLDGETVGVLGEVHPRVLKNAKIKRARPCYFEIDRDALLAPGTRPLYRPPPAEQPMERNLAFSLPHRVEADAIAAWLHASGPDWLERVSILDLFRYDEGSESRRAITYGLRFTGGRGADEVNQVLEELVQAVLEQYGAAGVQQR